MDTFERWREHAGHRLEVMADEDVAEGVMCVTCGEYVWEADDEDEPATPRGAVDPSGRWWITAWADGQPDALHADEAEARRNCAEGMRVVEVVPVNHQAGAVPDVEMATTLAKALRSYMHNPEFEENRAARLALETYERWLLTPREAV